MTMDPPSKGGFSISLGSKRPTGGSATTARKPVLGASAFSKSGTKRGPALSDDEDDDIHEDDHRDKVQLVTGFGSKGAVTAEGEKEVKALLIPALRNKDWRAESRKKKGIYLPPEATAQKNGQPVDTRDIIGDEPMKVGLQFVERSTAGMTIAEGDVAMSDAKDQDAEGEEATKKVEKTEDQLAMEALLAGDKAKASTLTIPAASGNVADNRVAVQNEDDAYRADVASRPDAATLEEYAAVPVEEFGAALLRGMGWKEGESIGKSGGAGNKPKIVEKRAAFLGIGAKGLGAEEMGAWGKGDKKGRQRVDKTYLPITLVDKNGNRVEEESSKDLVKKDVEKDWKGKNDKNGSERRDIDYRDDKESSRSKRDRERYRDDERDRDRRDRDKGRDRDRDKDSYRERSRDRRDRDRYKDKDSSRDYDRKHRSSEYDDRDRDRRRHRSRSRERHRR
ncbi:hypothetical protein TWF225_004280 [Orbilia oligospora]|uniref:Pre-mRNA-splicing factor n=1 Tax=Orbilia oligospora TaxID=2813651 RepID=A0A7C8K353_ORBOL|nr:hypothetical protein TWF225_004280 [Orbilia oligospora]KAF3162261.1 hypothetical protein TWF751_010841 [Orbilia oligospora]KAF3241696.1 hypothetical protein TWF128_010702 [Orbilia oligospora]KAF3241697.1 hypothetical protein TWF128_010702 [Orbilia oligospora]KAF3249796.1 hypothetical protein TWF217_008706 [Orbilia oligospora]